MDPITVNKLLSVADGIETRRRSESQLSLDTFHEIVESQGRVKRLERRVRDILRVFVAAKWITPSAENPRVLGLTENYHTFIHAWDSGAHLLPMNEGLTHYPPYASFLGCLEVEKKILIPPRQDKNARRNLGCRLKEEYGITFVAFDTFQTWAVSVGHAYRSPFENVLYWGGEWDTERPLLEEFKKACRKSYRKVDKTSGYANLGRLAHIVCQELQISFQAFEMKFNQFVENCPGNIRLVPATIRRKVPRRYQLISIRPRKEVLQERLAAGLLPNSKPYQPRWLEHRYLEDGMRVNGKLVKLIQWEVAK